MATSIIDYVFRVLGLEYLGRTDLTQVPPELDEPAPDEHPASEPDAADVSDPVSASGRRCRPRPQPRRPAARARQERQRQRTATAMRPTQPPLMLEATARRRAS